MAEKKLSFEESMARLEEIAAALEEGSVPLEKALALFEEGTGLIRRCSADLDKAEQKVRLLLKGEDGRPAEAKMEETEV